jgi:dTDP-4-amino-4,6-dideoxygalactose transaminase
MTTKAGYLLGLFAPFYFLSAADRKKFDAMFEEERSPFSPDRVLPLSNIQAAVGRRQLARLDELNAVRRMNAALLLEGLAGADGLGLPESIAEGEGTWNSFPVRVFSAPGFQRRMMLSGIDTRRDYMDVSAFAAEWSRHGDVVYLPNHPGLDGEDMNRVAAAARRAALKVRVKA